MELLTSAQWNTFREAINNASDTFNKKLITWHKFTRRVARYGEDESSNFTLITLRALIANNFYKTWPDESREPTGEKDDTSLVMILNKEYLRGLGYLNSNNYFIINPGMDYFTIDGIEYETKGDTNTSQAESDDLLVYLRLDRKQPKTGDDYHAGSL